MITSKTKTDLTIQVRLLDNSGTPITGILFSDVNLTISYRAEEDTDWTDVTLVNMTLGTYTDSGWIESPDANGYYDFGIPNAAALPGARVKWRFVYDTNEPQFGDIDYVALEESDIVFPTANPDVTFNFNIPGAETLFTNNPALFIKEKEVTVSFTADTDIESIPLVIIFEDSQQFDILVIPDNNINKVGNVATITLPNSFTDETGSYTWGIRNQDTLKVYGTGTISITYAPHEDV